MLLPKKLLCAPKDWILRKRRSIANTFGIFWGVPKFQGPHVRGILAGLVIDTALGQVTIPDKRVRELETAADRLEELTTTIRDVAKVIG